MLRNTDSNNKIKNDSKIVATSIQPNDLGSKNKHRKTVLSAPRQSTFLAGLRGCPTNSLELRGLLETNAKLAYE